MNKKADLEILIEKVSRFGKKIKKGNLVEVESDRTKEEGLTFLPFYIVNDDEGVMPIANFSFAALYAKIGIELWDKIAEVEQEKGIKLPDPFFSYVGEIEDGQGRQGPCYGNLNHVHNELITKFVYARDLKGFAEHPAIMDSYENRATWAYLQHCPDNLQIAIYWG